ncbi:hypothetical protein GCM10011581_09880 [Saccharopolyspora subtropica]|uniref:DUF3558 domain-containing protein n=1 Tax=Saccharopolyspora thermophila TaxID=89367 RepID=A0A917JN96_9PSEU|nr:DUF3558 domain-containing protein [Saccharopolyspora subtropica]GGI74919.1 hypothetical protein GCM10011581_09880 [Saccharopolyspora subtropica]
MSHSRSRVLAAGVVLTGALAACTGGGPTGDEAPQSSQRTQAQTGPEISDPRSPFAVELCALLPADAATSLGLEPTGKVDDSPKISPDTSDSCVWRSADRHTSVSLAPIKDRSIQVYYDNKSAFSDYQELTIAGYPAVRANQGDPAKDGFCVVFAAVSERDMLFAFTHDISKTDPCGLAQKALEASIPTLPPAK